MTIDEAASAVLAVAIDSPATFARALDLRARLWRELRDEPGGADLIEYLDAALDAYGARAHGWTVDRVVPEMLPPDAAAAYAAAGLEPFRGLAEASGLERPPVIPGVVWRQRRAGEP